MTKSVGFDKFYDDGGGESLLAACGAPQLTGHVQPSRPTRPRPR